MLERHVWLTMTEMKEADKVPFLDAPVSSGCLFGPAVEGFAECFTEAQKSSQVMQHFLPKPFLHNYMDARYHLRDDTQATDDPQGSPCAWYILLTPLGLIPQWILVSSCSAS